MTVGIVSPGAMGSAVGAAYRAGGRRVVTTVAGRGDRTRGLAEQAGLELVPDLDAVVAASELVLSIAPPDQARAIAADLVGAAGRTGARPLVSDWNAVSPATARELAASSPTVGSSSSTARSPAGRRAPTTHPRLRLGRQGGRARGRGPAWLDVRVVGTEVGLASAVKMSTASVYKGYTALLAHALATAHANGVLTEVLDDLHDSFPRQIDGAAGCSPSRRRRRTLRRRDAEIAATQPSAGLTPTCSRRWPRCTGGSPRRSSPVRPSIPPEPELEDVLERLVDAGERN